jgi:uncharacterized delta-60 repeat protein
VGFAYSGIGVSESDGLALIEVQRGVDTNASVSVSYSTTDGSARAGVDYLTASGTLFFAAGEVTKNFTVPVIDNGQLNGPRALTLTLTNPIGGTLGPAGSSIPLVSSDADQPVMVDPSFHPSLDGAVDSVAVYPDGRILISGNFATVNGLPRCGLARLWSDGSLDTNFDAGTAFPRCNSRLSQFPATITILTDGKILVSGFLKTTTPGGEVWNAETIRLQPDGPVDQTFKPTDGAGQFYPQSDGTLLFFDGTALLLLNSNGILLSWIGYNLPNCLSPIPQDPGFAFAPQSDGKFLIGGDVSFLVPSCSNQTALLRFNADGSSDPSFQAPTIRRGDNISGVDALVRMIFVDAAGRIIIGGMFDSVNGVPRRNLARLNPDGSLDEGFKPDSDSLWGGGASTGALQSDGKVLMAFNMVDEGGPYPLYRFNTNGSFDPTFRAQVPFARVLGLAPDGNVLVVGLDNKLRRLFGNSANLTGFTVSSDGDSTQPQPAVGVAAAGGKVQLNIYRLGPTTNSASVDYTTRDGTATSGADYIATGGTLTFGPRERVKSVTIALIANPDLKTERTFSLSLTKASQGNILGLHTEAAPTIAPQQLLTVRYLNSSTGAVVRLTLTPVVAGIQYQVEGSPNATFNWDPGNTYQIKTATNNPLEFEESSPGPQRFYRALRLGP